MKHIQLFSLFICLFVLRLSAQTNVYCPEAGTFSSTIAALNINKDTITYLQVSGIIDARDFKEIKNYLQLRSIDMSEVTINSYSGIDGTVTKFENGSEVAVTYNANEIPQYGISGGVERFVFPGSVKKVGDYLFSNHGIKEVVFPPKLDSIGKYAFAECVYLKKVVIPANLKYLGESAFRNCKTLDSPISLPSSLRIIGTAPFIYCTNIPKITLDKQNSYFVADDKDVVYSSNLDTLVLFPPYFKGKYRMTPKTKVIPNDAVRGVDGLTALIFPDSLKWLGGRSFLDCKNLKWIDFKNASTFTNHINTGIANPFAACPIDTIYTSCRQRPAGSLPVMLLGSGIRDSKVFVPIDSVEVFKKDSLWKEFSHIYGIETMPTSFDNPEITSFRVVNTTTQVSDTTLSSVTFEFHGNNISQYLVSYQSIESNITNSYTINNDTCLFEALNLDRRFDKRFTIYGTDVSGNKSETKEIVIKADMLNSVNNELTDKIQIYVTESNSLNILSQSNQVLTVKVYSVIGNCIINDKVLPGKNKYDIVNGSGIYIISIERNTRKLILQKVIVK